jgi:1-acyl-sn-glycerol-3-phosphate acyltransferase
MFDPKTTKYPYPDYTDGHYITLKKNNGLVFDKNYPYIDKSKWFRFKAWWFKIFLVLIVLPVVRIRLGFKVVGKENLKKHKDVINKGIVSCCNHVHYWEYLGMLSVIKSYNPKFLVWAPNIRGSLGGVMRLVGGIPIPEDDLSASIACSKSIGEYLDNGGWIHIFAEGSMWEYYKPIRPFKKGIASYACKHDVPVLPFAYRYRKPGFIRRKIFKQIALFTLHIGEPIYKDETLSKKDQIEDLTKRSHEAVCRLAGIEPKDNIYPPIYNNSKKVNYY